MISKMPDKSSENVLHDNVEDPFQLKNIAELKPEIIKNMADELNGILQKNRDPWLKS